MITPLRLTGITVSLIFSAAMTICAGGKTATRGRMSTHLASMTGKIIVTVTMTGRRHGRAAAQIRPQGGRASRHALPEPAPGAGDRSGVPGQRVLRRPRRGPGQIRDGAAGQGGRRPGHRGRRGVRVLPARLLPGGLRPGTLRAGRPGPGPARAARAAQAHRPDPHLGRAAARRQPPPPPSAAGAPDRGVLRRARAPPVGRESAGPPPGAPPPKPLTCPPARRGRRTPRPCPYHHRLAPRLLNRVTARRPARTPFPPAGWTPATRTCALPPCTRAPRRSRPGSAR